MWVAAAVMAVGALAQAYNSEQQRKADKESLKKIEDLYNKIKPPGYELPITAPPKLHEETLRQPQFQQALQTPHFDMSKLQPEELKLVGKYTPTIAPFVAEVNPRMIEVTKDMKSGRDAQLKALDQFQKIGKGGFDPQYQEAVQKASRQAQTEAQSRQQSILQDFARRGQGGSGLNLAAQLGGSAEAMDRSAMTNQAAATDAYKNRLNALMQGAQLGGQINQEETGFQQRNADIINAFNERTSRNRQAYENQKANQLSDASRYNLGVEQGLSNQNVANRNDAARYNQSNFNDILMQKYNINAQNQNRDDMLKKFGYQAAGDERNYQNNIALQKYGIAENKRNEMNDYSRQQYADQLTRAGLNAGFLGDYNKLSQQRTADQNQMIQGLSNAGASYGANQYASQGAQNKQLRDDDQAYFKKTGQWMSDEEREKRRKAYGEY